LHGFHGELLAWDVQAMAVVRGFNSLVTSKPVNGLKIGEMLEAIKKSERAMINKRERTIQLCGLWLMGAFCHHQHVLGLFYTGCA